MAINRVDFGGNTLIDLTGDTLESAEQLLKGIIAHAKDGSVIEGMLEAGGGGGGGEYEISTGIITPAENTESLSFEHGLSKAPSFVHIFLPIGQPVSSYSNSLRSMYLKKSFSGEWSDEKFDVYTSRSSTNYLYHENARQPTDVAFDINDTTVTAPGCGFNGSTKRKWLAGKPYHWICIAGEVVFPYT